MMGYRPLLAIFTAAILAGMTSFSTVKADYPVKPVNLIIGFGAGGGTDLAGRSLAREMQGLLGKPVTVVNKPGAASMIAAKFVAGSKPDGYTLWFGSAGTLVLKKELGQTDVDFFEDFNLIGFSGQLVPSIAVPSSSPFQSVQDLIDAAQAKPGELRWAHGGRGSAFFAAGVGFNTANKLDVQDVPYSGARHFSNAILSKQVDFGVLEAGFSLRFPEKLRVLGVLHESRDVFLNDKLVTLKELGIDFVPINSPVGVMAPKDVPDDVVAKLADVVEKAAATDRFKKSMNDVRQVATFMGPDEGTAFVANMQQNVQKILPQLGIK